MPEELYKNGIQRASFLPFIPFLRENTQIVMVETEKDFRDTLIEQERKFFSRLYYGKKFRKGDERVFQTFFSLNNEEDMELFR
jgi:predicted ATPase